MAFFVYCCAWMASSVDVVVHRWDVCVFAMMGLVPSIWGLVDRITMGSAFSLITTFVQLNCGSNVVSHG